MIQNLAYIGAVPFGGIWQVRIHWLLDLITITQFSRGVPVYNFAKLDALINLLHENGLKPGFELMGSPSGFYNDFENRTQVLLWKELIKMIAQRYIDKYGINYVKNWNFETWNEPDCHDFDNVSMTVQGFLNYYDACSEGLKEVSSLLKLGGPGDGCYHHFDHIGNGKRYGTALLNHVVNGSNYFTGEKGIRLDFISWHLKGQGKSTHILELEEMLMVEIESRYPTLAKKPFYNDEADPLVGWSKNETWRADVTYAALVAKIIAQHQNVLRASSRSKIKYTLLSNDNAFLSYYPHQFMQRTLLARFQMNNTQPHHVQFICKPVHTVMAMLSLLGEHQLIVNLTDGTGVIVKNDSHLGLMATVHYPKKSIAKDSFQLALLLYNSYDVPTSHRFQEKLNSRQAHNDSVDYVIVELYLNLPNATDLYLVGYGMNNSFGNPYFIWSRQGKPAFPTKEEFAAMRHEEGPLMMFNYTVKTGSIRIPLLTLSAPTVFMIHICAKPVSPPGQVINVKLYNITNNQVLVVWSDEAVKTKCILTYEVQFSKSGALGPYKRVNKDNSILSAFVFAPSSSADVRNDALVQGFYRVLAIDYWNRHGAPSSTIQYPPATSHRTSAAAQS